MAEITVREFDEANRALHEKIDALAVVFRDGHKGTHDRLDKLNGKVDRHTGEIGGLRTTQADHARAIKNLNHEVFEAPRAAPAIPPELLEGLRAVVARTGEDQQPALTQRDIRVLGAAGKAIWALAGAAVLVALWLLAQRGAP